MPDNALHSSAFASADSDAVVSGFLDLSIYFCILTHSVFLGLDTCGIEQGLEIFHRKRRQTTNEISRSNSN